MKLIDRNFFEISKKLFWIVQFRKLTYFKYFIKSLIVGINMVIHVLFLAQITGFLEGRAVDSFNEILIIYLIYILCFEVSFFLMKSWGWMETVPMGQQDILNKYLVKYIKLDNNEVEKIGTGKIYNLFDRGMLEWTEIVVDIFENGTSLLVSIVFTLYMISKVSFMYGLIFIVLLILFVIIGSYSNKKLWIFRKKRYSLRSNLSKNLVKVFMSKVEILSAGKIDNELIHTNNISTELAYVNMKMGFHRVMLKRISQFSMSMVLLFSFWYLGNEYLIGNINLSVLVGITGALIIMQKSIGSVISLYVKITKRFVSVERFWNFFDTTPEIKGYEEGKDFKYKTGNICIKNMSFSYNKSNKIFNNFNLNILGGKITALVGNSGSGKTTLVKIISGYLRHNSGDILIDGQKNKEVSLKTLYKHIGYLTQEPSVFDGSIRKNLLYGIQKGLNDNNVEERLLESVKQAKCEFVYEFENGLDTEIGEKGIRLSGGQRQRLAIAKIFLKNPEIIILDEPTSALDSFSEEKITEAMHNLFKGRTVIIIAHRLQTVKNADTIFVLKNGDVVEEGNHQTLIEKNGIYKNMLDLQSGF